MISKEIKDTVSKATVRLRGNGGPRKKAKGGQGILIRNGYIITTSTCLTDIQNVCKRINSGEITVFEIETVEGEVLRMAPVFFDHLSDLAVLGPLDRINYPEEWMDDYEKFCKSTKPLPLWCSGPSSSSEETPLKFNGIPVHIYTHFKTWITGKVWDRDNLTHLYIVADHDIEGSTKGSPVVNERGELISVVSNLWDAGHYKGKGAGPFIDNTLPIWLHRSINS